MVSLASGQVVIVRFPFSNLTASKLRPAVVLASSDRDDWILCQITSKPYGDTRNILLETIDFSEGSLQLTSFVRPGKLFTANIRLVVAIAGRLKPDKFESIRDAVKRTIEGTQSPSR